MRIPLWLLCQGGIPAFRHARDDHIRHHDPDVSLGGKMAENRRLGDLHLGRDVFRGQSVGPDPVGKHQKHIDDFGLSVLC